MPTAVELAEHGDRQGAAGQQHKGRHFGGFDDIAGFARLFQALLCRLFGLLRMSVVGRFSHGLTETLAMEMV